MSAISSIGSLDQTLLMQQVQQQMESGPPEMANGMTGPPPMSGQGPPGETQFVSVAESFGLDSEEAESLHSDVQTAVQEALDGLAEGEDPRAAIETAIGGVMEEYGIDAEAFKAEMESQMGGPPPGGPGGGMSGVTYDPQTMQSDLLSSLLEGDEDDSSSSSSLPSGFLYDVTA